MSLSLILTALLAVLVFAFVGYPLLRPRRAEPAIDAEAEELEELLVKRDATLAAIKELEFDHEAGSLSDEDFSDMEERYRHRAIAILQQLDQLQAGETAEDVIERQVAALRQAQDDALRQAQGIALRRDQAGEPAAEAEVEGVIEQQVQQIRQERRAAAAPGEAGAAFCFNCGARLRGGAQFCPSCGVSLTERRCAQCGASLEPEDRFCAQCGAAAGGS